MTHFRLRWLTFAGLALVAWTEALGALRWLGAGQSWVVAAAALLLGIETVRRSVPRFRRPEPIEWVSAAGIAGIGAITALTAWLSAPNSADAMAYHLPRVLAPGHPRRARDGYEAGYRVFPRIERAGRFAVFLGEPAK